MLRYLTTYIFSLFWPFLFVFLGCLILIVVYYWMGKLKNEFVQTKVRKVTIMIWIVIIGRSELIREADRLGAVQIAYDVLFSQCLTPSPWALAAGAEGSCPPRFSYMVQI